MPSRRRPSIMTRVSSLSSAPRSSESPLASAAATKARFVRLFEPGGRIVVSNGLAIGWISMASIVLRDLPRMLAATNVERAFRHRWRRQDLLADRSLADHFRLAAQLNDLPQSIAAD